MSDAVRADPGQWVVNIRSRSFRLPTSSADPRLQPHRQPIHDGAWPSRAGTWRAGRQERAWNTFAADQGGQQWRRLLNPDPGSRFQNTGGWRALTIEAPDYLVVLAAPTPIGWSPPVAWADRDVVAKPLADAFLVAAAGGVLLAALVLVVYGVSLQIGCPVHGLEVTPVVRRRPAGRGGRFPSRRSTVLRGARRRCSPRRRQAAETEVPLPDARAKVHRSKEPDDRDRRDGQADRSWRDTKCPEFVSS